MLMNRCHSITLLLLFIFSSSIAQEYLFNIEHINVEQGLPEREVYTFAIDQKEYIWLSTQGAISRYDGNNFKTYDNTFLKIKESNSSTLAFDERNNLWYSEATSPGDSNFSGVLDTQTDSIYALEDYTNGILNSQNIRGIKTFPQYPGVLFIGTDEGLFYKYHKGVLTVVGKFLGKSSYIDFQIINDSEMWVVTYTHALRIKDEQIILKVPLPTLGFLKIINNIESNSGSSLYLKIDNTNDVFPYWVLEGQTFRPYRSKSLQEESKVIVYIEKEYGIYVKKDSISIYNNEGNLIYKKILPKLNINGVSSIYAVPSHNLLLIGSSNGFLKLTQEKNPFTIYGKNLPFRGVYVDSNQLILAGGEKCSYDLSTQSKQRLALPAPSSSINLNPIRFHKTSSGTLWMGFERPILYEYRSKNDSVLHVFDKAVKLEVPYENPITQNLLVGSNRGLFFFDRPNKDIIPIDLKINPENLIIRHFHQNKQGIWVSTNQGIFLLNAQTEKLIKHYSTNDGLPSNNFNFLHEDANGIFWLAGRGGGLIRWDRTNNNFRQFTKLTGLSDNVIYSVYEDDFNNLWLPSNYGLMRFEKEALISQVYLPEHGLPHEEFNTYADAQGKDGQLYFGGLGGVISFHPKDLLNKQQQEYPLHLSKLSVLTKGKDNYEDRTNEYIKEQSITLRPKDQILEIEVILLEYANSDKRAYAYQIAGYQEQWIYTNESKLSFFNLPYGQHTINIRARGASGKWTNDYLKVPVFVEKPIYLQWWFFLMIAFLVLSLGIAIVRWREQQLQNDKINLENQVAIRTKKIEQDRTIILKQAEELKELDKAKTRFFSNITHEFRTPLTLIIGPIQQMIQMPKKEITADNLVGVLNNSKILLKLINQLLDISKLESGKMKIEVSHGDIMAYTKTLVNSFQALATTKHQRLIFQTSPDQWSTHFDQDKWDKIVYNLVFNAIKFTPEKGTIQLSLFQKKTKEKEWIYLKVRDSGIGIEETKLAQIFNRFYQTDDSTTRVQDGTGIGLALVSELVTLLSGEVSVVSKINKGTTFEVKIPVLPATANVNYIENLITNPPAPHLPILEPSINNHQSSSQNKSLQLLLVEDNKEMLEYVERCIDDKRYNITTAKNGQEGIEKALALIPDLIISDVMMPIKDGFELTKTIRETTATSHIPIILLTAKAALSSKLEGIERGADVYLTKPFSPDELNLRIQKLIEIRQVLQNRYQNSNTALLNSSTEFKKEDAFILQLRKYILQHLDVPNINGDILGEHMKISRMQVHRKIKALTNCTTTEFVQSIRLEAAKKLLLEQQLNVTEVAHQTGFSSANYFSGQFKKKYGFPPSKVLKSGL